MPAKMICPRCGTEMNFHAEKMVYSDSVSNPDTALGGTIQEMHSCPHCGRTESRPSLQDTSSS